MIQQQQQTIPSDQLPRGVESVHIGYSYYGRPRVMVTLQQKPRRQLMAFGAILLVFAPLVLVFTSVCIALRHYYLAYSYAAGVLYVVTGSIAVCASKTNNACALRAVMALAIQCMVWSIIMTVASVIMAAIIEDRSIATIVMEVLLAVIGLLGFSLCLAVTVFFCKITCGVRYAPAAGCPAMMCPPHTGQQVIICGQQQQPVPAGVVGPPAYNTVEPPTYQQQQYPTSSFPPSYDNAAVDHKDKV